MKTLKLSTAKRLQEHLKDVEVEYYYATAVWKSAVLTESPPTWRRMVNRKLVKTCFYKTLTLEEALDFLPDNIKISSEIYTLRLEKKGIYYLCQKNKEYMDNNWVKCTVGYFKHLTKELMQWKTLLIAIDRMINHLLDNNLI